MRDTATHLSNLAKDSAPIVCRYSSTVADHVLSSRPHSGLQAAQYNHSRTSRPSRRLGCKLESIAADGSIRVRVLEAGGGLTLGESFFVVRKFVQGIQEVDEYLLPFRGAPFARLVLWCGCP